MSYRIGYFDLWQAGYGGASVAIYVAGTQTLASVYTDEALTVPAGGAGNPQTLLERTIDGISYGKWAVPLYTNQAVELVVNSTDETGIVRSPLTTLGGQDASLATLKAAGASQDIALEDFAARWVHIEDQGVFLPTSDPAASSTTNNATLVAAIAAAAGAGGGLVDLPEGAYEFTQFNLPANVLLLGRGRGVTTLQSVVADKVVTVSGDHAGFAALTLDGVSKQAGSIGVYLKSKNELVFNDAEVKRFATGVKSVGGRRYDWGNLYVENCVTGVQFRGDNDAGAGGGGDECRNHKWQGGRVTNCTTAGVELLYVDKKVYHVSFDDVGFETNTGTALKVTGARYTRLAGCWFTGNTTDWAISDGADTTKADENTVLGYRMSGGHVSGGTATFTGTVQDVIFDGVEFFNSCTLSLATCTNNILAKSCTEDATVTISGADSIKWTRTVENQGDAPGAFVLTSDATATAAWAETLQPGEAAIVRAMVVGVRRNGDERGFYHVARGVRRPGSTLAYDTQTANFTVGQVLTGATSGATARIIADVDAGATGTLTLKDISKEFVVGEIITDAAGGSAKVTSVLSHQNAALVGATTSIQAAVEDDATWDADFGVSGGKVRVIVTGAAAKTIEWQVNAELVRA